MNDLHSPPDVIVIPRGGVNPEVADLNAAYAAAHWGVPVVDLNSEHREFQPEMVGDAGAVALSVRSFALQEAQAIEARLAAQARPPVIGSLRGPIDVLCCYRYVDLEARFDAALTFGDHLPDPVPLLVSNWSVELDENDERAGFDEDSASTGALGLLEPGDLSELLWGDDEEHATGNYS